MKRLYEKERIRPRNCYDSLFHVFIARICFPLWFYRMKKIRSNNNFDSVKYLVHSLIMPRVVNHDENIEEAEHGIKFEGTFRGVEPKRSKENRSSESTKDAETDKRYPCHSGLPSTTSGYKYCGDHGYIRCGRLHVDSDLFRFRHMSILTDSDLCRFVANFSFSTRTLFRAAQNIKMLRRRPFRSS